MSRITMAKASDEDWMGAFQGRKNRPTAGAPEVKPQTVETLCLILDVDSRYRTIQHAEVRHNEEHFGWLNHACFISVRRFLVRLSAALVYPRPQYSAMSPG